MDENSPGRALESTEETSETQGNKKPENNCVGREGSAATLAGTIPSPGWHRSVPGGNHPVEFLARKGCHQLLIYSKASR